MIGLFSEHLAGRLDLRAPDADLLKKHRQRVNTLRSAYQNRSHVVLGAAKTDGVHLGRRMDPRALPATDMEGDGRSGRIPGGRRHLSLRILRAGPNLMQLSRLCGTPDIVGARGK